MSQTAELMVRESVKTDDMQLVLFVVGNETYGVRVLAVQEIIRYQSITTVPHAPEFVRGVINLRGRIIPIIDLRERFGLPCQDATSATRIVVVDAGGTTVGLIVDSVDEVRNMPTADVEPPSPIVTTVASEFLMGVGRLPGHNGEQRLVILLDLDRITTAEQHEELAAAGQSAA